MDKKTITDISSGLRSTYQKACEAVKKNNYEYALDLFKSIIKKEPGFMQARLELRDVERTYSGSLGGFAKFMITIKNQFGAGKIKAMIKKDPLAAVNMAEDMVAKNISDPVALNLLADAAVAAGEDEIAIEAYEIFREYAPKNEKNLRNLANVYKRNGHGTQVLGIFQEISGMHPNDLNVQQELKAAAALASMEQGHWEEGGDFRNKLKDEEQADSLEKKDRVARSEDDMADMISRFEEAINNGEDTVDNYKKLAEYYYRSRRFQDAVNAYEAVMQKIGVFDLLIDGKIEKANMALFQEQIDSAQAAGEDVAQLEEAKYNYRMQRAVERVNAYPNDNNLRFELALVYYDGNFIDEALEQFQIAQRAPKYRIAALTYMGRCFHRKSQFDLAVEQLEKVVGEYKSMNNDKKEALYDLGNVYLDMGDNDKAGNCFKLIYQEDISYKDVSERMKKIYG
jgi:tetratricopeptide (TPR) repeat protein